MRRWLDVGWTRWLLRLGVATVAGLVLLAMLIVIAYKSVRLPAETRRPQTSVVLDAEGNVIAELYDIENRTDVALDDVSPAMVDAVVAAEDRSFRDHGGLDRSGIARALWVDLRGGGLQGGSTITQQLVKNSYLTSQRTVSRKLKEAILAIKVERQLSKDEILERYLNRIYFGRGAYGVEAAAQAYFATGADDLDVAQSALLAGLIRSPESADPTRSPDIARRRRASVLDAMVATGALTGPERAAAAGEELAAIDRPEERIALEGSTAYFADQVRRWAVRTYGDKAAFGGGLTIETSLDPRLQVAAEEAVFETLDQVRDPDAALVAVDERGAIVAMIGGRDFATNQVNFALGAEGGGQGRQPGSTFKPFVLQAALDAGITVDQRFPGPSEITVDVDDQEYPVENYGEQAFGNIDLVTATANSVNTVYAQLVAETGAQAVADAATAAGITAELEPFPAIALGSEEVAPLDMASAYMTYARRGDKVTPWYVERVTGPDGAILHTAEPERERVMERRHADLINEVLQRVVTDGTGTAADIGRPAAGKTGTTQDNTNAWFVGYTPTLGAAVWMGYGEEGQRPMEHVRGGAVTGGGLPAQIWQRFMTRAVAGLPAGDFTPPAEEEPDPPQAAPPTTARKSATTSTTWSYTTSSSYTTSPPGPPTTAPPPATTTTRRSTTTTQPSGPVPPTTLPL
ncbi:MAG: PBP1A family penicillin-binding protein [Acidimicrobiales bacterium]